MKNVLNYIYSIVIKVLTDKNGVYSNRYASQRIILLLILFGVGSFINILLIPFFKHPGILFVGFIISPVIWLMYYLLVGFEYIERVKNMSYSNALIILVIIHFLILVLFLLPILLLKILT